MKCKITLSVPFWRKDVQTMTDPIVKLMAGPGDTKHRDGFGKSLEKHGQERAIKGF